jgi:transcriptional antiterminator NusG
MTRGFFVSKDKPKPRKEKRTEVLEEPEEKTQIFAVKTSIGHEKIVADVIASRAKRKDATVFSILAPQNLRGYLLVEAKSEERLRHLIKGIPKVRGVVSGERAIDMSELETVIEPKPLTHGIVVGDIVELVAGPFKGEKARVKQIDESKEEITVELFEAVISIPITVRADHVRVIEKEKER